MAYSSAFGLAQRSSAFGLAHIITVALASAVTWNWGVREHMCGRRSYQLVSSFRSSPYSFQLKSVKIGDFARAVAPPANDGRIFWLNHRGTGASGNICVFVETANLLSSPAV